MTVVSLLVKCLVLIVWSMLVAGGLADPVPE